MEEKEGIIIRLEFISREEGMGLVHKWRDCSSRGDSHFCWNKGKKGERARIQVGLYSWSWKDDRFLGLILGFVVFNEESSTLAKRDMRVVEEGKMSKREPSRGGEELESQFTSEI